MKYSREFEDYFKNHIHVQCLREFQSWDYKRAVFNAFKAGKKAGIQKTINGILGEGIRA